MALASIDASGWSSQYVGTPPTFTPDTSPELVAVGRNGYTAAGSTTTYAENFVVTKRVRQPYPNQTSPSATTVSLSRYAYSTDSISGVTNNSTEASPAPVLNWQQCDRQLVGNLLEAEVTGGHKDARNGKPLACVIFTVTDGSITLTQTVSAQIISPSAGDKKPNIVWRCSIDITSLATGQITLNAEGVGWIGGSTARNNSATNGSTQNTRDFCPQIYTKNVALLAARPRLYIDAAGNDTTGYVGTNDASAQAAPCATLVGAFTRARTVLGTGACDGLLIYLNAGTWELSASVTAGAINTNHEVIITRNPAVPRASAIYGFGTGNFNNRATFLRIQDVAILRGGLNSLGMTAGGKAVIRNCDINNGSFNAAFCSVALYLEGGVAITNGATLPFTAGTPEIRLFRGVTYGINSGNYAVEGWNVTACDLRGVIFTRGSRSQSGMIIAFNTNLGIGATDACPIGASNNVTGSFVVQNVWEYISTGQNPTFRPSSDSATGSITHLMAWNNTFIGSYIAGRGNILYDDGPNGNFRTHKLQSFVGNIHVQINCKNDWFAGVNLSLPDASAHVGNWSYANGCECQGEFAMYVDAGPNLPQFRQDYPGLGAKIGTSTSVRNDPLFVSYQGTTYNGSVYTAGAGGGDYDLQAGSPCATMVPQAVLPFDLKGRARPITNDSAGAYTTYTPPSATGFSASGPSIGLVNNTSSNFTITSSGGPFTGTQSVTIYTNNGVIIATSSGGIIVGNGTNSAQVTPPAGSTSFTFTITPASVGVATITFTNGQGWANPAPLLYTVTSPTPPSGCSDIFGLPISSQLDAIYCAMVSDMAPAGLPSCSCVKGLDIRGKLTAIYCYFRDASDDTTLPSCACVKGYAVSDILAAIYCAIKAESVSAETPTCACVRGLMDSDKISAIYCLLFADAGSPAALPSCACVKGLTIPDKWANIYRVLTV